MDWRRSTFFRFIAVTNVSKRRSVGPAPSSMKVGTNSLLAFLRKQIVRADRFAAFSLRVGPREGSLVLCHCVTGFRIPWKGFTQRFPTFLARYASMRAPVASRMTNTGSY